MSEQKMRCMRYAFILPMVILLSCGAGESSELSDKHGQTEVATEEAQGTINLVLDSVEVRQRIVEAPSVSVEDIVSNTWSCDSTIVQYFESFYEGHETYEETEDMGYHYTFYESGEYEIEAIISSDGTWNLDTETKLLSMTSNLRSTLDQENHVLISNGRMEWISIDENGIYISIFHAVE